MGYQIQNMATWVREPMVKHLWKEMWKATTKRVAPICRHIVHVSQYMPLIKIKHWEFGSIRTPDTELITDDKWGKHMDLG